MTDKQIEEQIETIKQATKEASKSKETAIKFLRDAGILRNETAKPTKKKI
jgi:hypothetical protein